MSLKLRINDDMKTAMKARDTARLGAIRLLMAAMKQKEVDERVDMDDAAIVAVIEKMLKQRKDSITQFEAGGRQDLADKEKFEVDVLIAYLPKQLDTAEVAREVEGAIAQVATEAGRAAGPQDIGKIMGLLKAKLAGKADMTAVSALVKQGLAK